MKRLMKNVMQKGRRAGLVRQRLLGGLPSSRPDSVGLNSAIPDSRSAIRSPRPDSVGVNSTLHALRSTTAFTLIEVMIAVVVVTMGIVAVLGLIPVGMKSARDAADNTLAATIAQDCFSQMRQFALAPAGWPPAAVNVYYDAAGTNQVLVGSADRYFRIQVTSQPSPTPNLQIIAATVTWPDKQSMTVTPPNTNIFVTEIARYQ